MSTIKVNKIENTATSDGGIAIDSTGHVTADNVQLPADGGLGYRNLVVNGSMIVAQRGTSSTGNTLSAYTTCDRWYLSLSSLATWTTTQETETQANAPDGFTKSFKVDCTTAEASPAAGDFAAVMYHLEAQDLQHLEYGESTAKSLICSFYVKSNKTGNASWEIQQRDNSDRQFCATYAIGTADTWEKKTIIIPADASGAINDDNGVGLRMAWWLHSGSNFTGGSHATTWQAEVNANRNASNIGIGGSTDDYFQITAVQLELGNVATEFEHKSYCEEIEKCKRYYRRWTADASNAYRVAFVGHFSSTTLCRGLIDLSPEMRTGPSLGSRQTSDFDLEPFDNTINSQPTLDEATRQQVTMLYTSSGGESIGDSAWLCIDTSGGYLELDAEH